MVVNNTVKNEGCANDKIKICSVQSYVKDERGDLNSAKYNPIVIEHGVDDISIKAVTYDIIKDKSGKIIERRASNKKEKEELTH